MAATSKLHREIYLQLLKLANLETGGSARNKMYRQLLELAGLQINSYNKTPKTAEAKKRKSESAKRYREKFPEKYRGSKRKYRSTHACKYKPKVSKLASDSYLENCLIKKGLPSSLDDIKLLRRELVNRSESRKISILLKNNGYSRFYKLDKSPLKTPLLPFCVEPVSYDASKASDVYNESFRIKNWLRMQEMSMFYNLDKKPLQNTHHPHGTRESIRHRIRDGRKVCSGCKVVYEVSFFKNKGNGRISHLCEACVRERWVEDRDGLTDTYVKHLLPTGFKSNIDLIEMKRSIVRLKRACNTISGADNEAN